ncbi:MAG: orotidine-5'-phosphate decarboxylase [Flavobacteriales bacterium]
MTRAELVSVIKRKRSLLCVGLDTEAHLVPAQFQAEEDPVLAFNKAIVDATHHIAVAYKLNLAFYEALGVAGWTSLERTVEAIRAKGDCFIIADAKRGDIGNTARKYAEAFFDTLGFDAVTISPYMGNDSVTPFLGRKGKWAIVLGVTSNEGAMDFQFLPVDKEQHRLFERVMTKVAEWGSPADTMFVVGATRTDVLVQARAAAPEHFFLVPGVGAQGGDLNAVMGTCMTADGGLLINSSRAIIYASKGHDAAQAAGAVAREVQRQMEAALRKFGVIT